MATHLRALEREYERLEEAGELDDVREAMRWERRLADMTTVMARYATKLRLTPQTQIDRRSGMRNERGIGTDADDDTHPLLGGAAMRKPN